MRYFDQNIWSFLRFYLLHELYEGRMGRFSTANSMQVSQER